MPQTSLDTFLQLVRYSLHEGESESANFKNADWNVLLQLSVKQSVLGLCFSGIQRLPEDQMPDEDTLLEWIGQCRFLEHRNRELCKTIGQLNSTLQADGFRTCLLKGEANGRYYRQPLMRKPGDIDLWVEPAKGEAGALKQWREKVIAYIADKTSDYHLAPHHIGFKLGDVEVEVHFTPSIVHAPVYNHRLQQWYKQQMDAQFAHSVTLPDGKTPCAVPTAPFDSIFQLTHIYHHLFEAGLSLRLILDYYSVVTSPDFKVDKDEYVSLLKHLGLYRLAQGMAYTMIQLLGMPAESYPVPADEQAGRKIIDWMFEGGEFGFYGKNASVNARQGSVAKYVNDTRRAINLLPTFPSEAFFEPITHINRFIWGWRKKKR